MNNNKYSTNNILSEQDRAAIISSLEGKQVWTIYDLSIYTGYEVSYLYKLTSRARQVGCNNPLPFHKPSGKRLFFNRERIQEWLLSDQDLANLEDHQLNRDSETKESTRDFNLESSVS